MENLPANQLQANLDRRSRIRALLRIRYLLKWLPRKRTLSRIPVLGKFSGHLRTRTYLWSFKEHQVGPAILVGSVVAFLPLFGVQLITVMVLALILKVNLPIIAGLQFISNPFTLIPIYLANYKVGSWLLEILGLSPIQSGEKIGVVFGVNSTMLGGIVLGSLFGLVLYALYLIRIKWPFRTSEVAL